MLINCIPVAVLGNSVAQWLSLQPTELRLLADLLGSASLQLQRNMAAMNFYFES